MVSGRRTGAKRHRIQIQEYATTRSSQGDTIRAFTTIGEYWAELMPLTGLEKEQADQQKAIASHRIYMRFFTPGVDESMRVLFDGREFNIVSVINPGERGIDTIIDVKEVKVK